MKALTRSLLVSVMIVAGTATFSYPAASQWITQTGQNEANEVLQQHTEDMGPNEISKMLQDAQSYNEALLTGSNLESYSYNELLRAPGADVMARLLIPSIELDQPVRHGMGDDALLHGVGHADYTSLPVGGIGTNSVLLAHRGLADTVGFSNLTSVVNGDLIFVEVAGETLTYKVYDTETLLPLDAAEHPIDPDRDILTLLTCTPMGINSHRYVVYAERIENPADIEHPMDSGQPGFPWWAIAIGASLAFSIGYTVGSSRSERKASQIATSTPSDGDGSTVNASTESDSPLSS